MTIRKVAIGFTASITSAVMAVAPATSYAYEYANTNLSIQYGRYIDDQSDVLGSRASDRVTELNDALKKDNGKSRFVVVTLDSIPDGYDIESYGNNVLNESLGNKADESVVLIIDTDESKGWTAMGSKVSGSIDHGHIDDALISANDDFKNDDYTTGVIGFTKALAKELGVDMKDTSRDKTKSDSIFGPRKQTTESNDDGFWDMMMGFWLGMMSSH